MQKHTTRSSPAAGHDERAEPSVAKIPAFTLAMLEEKLAELKGHWFETIRGGDGAAGHTLECLLGLQENNLSVPDWGEFELKTCRRESSALITLASKSPKRMGDITRREFILKHGYEDDTGRIGLNCTVSSSYVNTRGWRLQVTSDNQRVDFEHLGAVVAYQDLPLLTGTLARKVRNVVLVTANLSHDASGVRVCYLDAHLLAGIRENELASLIKLGEITFDWRMYLKPDGSVRDHGPVYRIPESHIPQLYSMRRRIL